MAKYYYGANTYLEAKTELNLGATAHNVSLNKTYQVEDVVDAKMKILSLKSCALSKYSTT